MIIAYVLFTFVLGICFGSFINAYVYRKDKNISIKGRSFCPSCKKTLAWYDLIPVISYLTLTGKCRYCKKKISFQYPLVEILSGLSLVLLFWSFGIFFNNSQNYILFVKILLLSLLSFVFVLVSVYDAKFKYVLSNFVYIGITASLVLNFIIYYQQDSLHKSDMMVYFSAIAIPVAVFYFLYKYSKEKWMGAGDVEVAALIGVFLDWPLTLISFYFSFFVASIYGLALIYLKKGKMKSAIPFVPFLISGIYFALAFGKIIITFYDKMFLGS